MIASESEVILNDMGEIHQYQTTTDKKNIHIVE